MQDPRQESHAVSRRRDLSVYQQNLHFCFCSAVPLFRMLMSAAADTTTTTAADGTPVTACLSFALLSVCSRIDNYAFTSR